MIDMKLRDDYEREAAKAWKRPEYDTKLLSKDEFQLLYHMKIRKRYLHGVETSQLKVEIALAQNRICVRTSISS